MHGRIFEIRETRVDKEEWLNEAWLYDEPMEFCNYICDSEDREDDLEWLKGCLPPSIFKVEGDEIEVISDGKEYIEEWLEKVRKEAESLSYESVMSGCGTYGLREKLKNVFGTDFMFYTDGASYCHNSFNFLRDCVKLYQGKKLYVCGIIGYHY